MRWAVQQSASVLANRYHVKDWWWLPPRLEEPEAATLLLLEGRWFGHSRRVVHDRSLGADLLPYFGSPGSGHHRAPTALQHTVNLAKEIGGSARGIEGVTTKPEGEP